MDTRKFSALAEPKRLQIVELLRDRPCSVNEVADILKIRQPQASKHLRALHEAGFVNVQPVAQKRIYVLKQEAFIQLDDWVSSFNQYWSNRLNKLDSYLTEKGTDK